MRRAVPRHDDQDTIANADDWKVEEPAKKLIAKRDFEIHCNDDHFYIKAGDDIARIPEKYHQNLRTEKVID